MGYNLYIGEAEIDWSEDCVRIGAKAERHDDAPAFGEPTDFTNSRWPSYSGWAEFCADMGLVDVMLNERNGGCGEFQYKDKWIYPLMPTHPGESPVTKLHLEYVEEKVAAYKAAHPDHFAQYAPLKPGVEKNGFLNRDEDFVDDPRYDSQLCRAEWLLYWMRWAVANCEKPVFVNT